MAEAPTIEQIEAQLDQVLDERLQQRAENNMLTENVRVLREDLEKYKALVAELEKQPAAIADWLEQNVESVYYDESPVAAALTQAASEIRELAWKRAR